MSESEPKIEIIEIQKGEVVMLIGHVPPTDYYLNRIIELVSQLNEEYKPLFGTSFIYLPVDRYWVSILVLWRKKKWWEKLF